MTEFDVPQTDRLLTTTRSVRKRLDLQRPVEPEVIQECIRIAIQAPTGGNVQQWRWLVVTDPDKRARLAELYRDATKIVAERGYGTDDAQRARPGPRMIPARRRWRGSSTPGPISPIGSRTCPCM